MRRSSFVPRPSSCLHFAFAFVAFFNFVGRIYWGFAGNTWVRWAHFLPLTPSGFKKDLIESAAILGATPAVHLVTVSIDEMTPMYVELSPPVQAAVPEVVRTVRALVESLARGGTDGRANG